MLSEVVDGERVWCTAGEYDFFSSAGVNEVDKFISVCESLMICVGGLE